jgi:alkylhydroperoxidase family enzyme
VQHHFSGFKRLLDHSEKANKYLELVMQDKLTDFFEEQFLSGITYAKKLTIEVQNINESDVDALKNTSFSDGEILEINQVTAYFNYANRTVVGLDVNLYGDIIGLSPNDSDDPNNWSHS